MTEFCTHANRVLSVRPGKLVGPLKLVSFVLGGSENAGAKVQSNGSDIDARQYIKANAGIQSRHSDRRRVQERARGA